MKIDAHQHFWIYKPEEYGWIDDSMLPLRRDFLPADLMPELDRGGFQGCVAVQARQTLQETQWLLGLAVQNAFIVGVVGWVNLCAPAAELTKQLSELKKNSKLVGIRHVVQAEPDERFLLRPDFLRGVGLLEQFDLAYDILIYPKHLSVAAEFAARFPQQRFVLDHLAKPLIKQGTLQPWKQGIEQLAKNQNVFCKLSGMVTEADRKNWKPEQMVPYLDVALECFGPERLMIGSDWPVCLLAANYARAMDVVRSYISKLDVRMQDAIMGGNAARFWKLQVMA